MNKTTSILAQFIPIFFCFFAAVYTNEFMKFITSFLGKAISVFIIVFYSAINKFYGLLVASILVYMHHMSHQMSMFEGFDKNDFMQKHCDHGKLRYKGSVVNYEMAEHVFPEILYNYKENRCNPCDNACEYTIIEEKIRADEEIVRNPNLNKKEEDRYSSILNFWKSPIASMGVFSEPFSYL